NHVVAENHGFVKGIPTQDLYDDPLGQVHGFSSSVSVAGDSLTPDSEAQSLHYLGWEHRPNSAGVHQSAGAIGADPARRQRSGPRQRLVGGIRQLDLYPNFTHTLLPAAVEGCFPNLFSNGHGNQMISANRFSTLRKYAAPAKKSATEMTSEIPMLFQWNGCP